MERRKFQELAAAVINWVGAVGGLDVDTFDFRGSFLFMPFVQLCKSLSLLTYPKFSKVCLLYRTVFY